VFCSTFARVFVGCYDSHGGVSGSWVLGARVAEGFEHYATIGLKGLLGCLNAWIRQPHMAVSGPGFVFAGLGIKTCIDTTFYLHRMSTRTQEIRNLSTQPPQTSSVHTHMFGQVHESGISQNRSFMIRCSKIRVHTHTLYSWKNICISTTIFPYGRSANMYSFCTILASIIATVAATVSAFDTVAVRGADTHMDTDTGTQITSQHKSYGEVGFRSAHCQVPKMFMSEFVQTFI
jgi:hypothetical protein